jgi:hypothetical protein
METAMKFFLCILFVTSSLFAQEGLYLSAGSGLSSLGFAGSGSINYYRDSKIFSVRSHTNLTFNFLGPNHYETANSIEAGYFEKSRSSSFFISAGPAYIFGEKDGELIPDDSDSWFNFSTEYEKIPIQRWGLSLSGGLQYLLFGFAGIGLESNLSLSKDFTRGALMVNLSLGYL